MVYNQQNHILISRNNCHDINLNIISNISIITRVFKLKGKIQPNFQLL